MKIFIKILIIILIIEIYHSNNYISLLFHLKNKYKKNKNYNVSFGEGTRKIFSYKLNSFFEYTKNITNQTDIYFKLHNITYSFSVKYFVAQIQYEINFYYKNHTIIKPSNLALFNNIHILCHTKYINSNLLINSYANIKENNNFKCIEYIKVNDKIKFGIKLYKNQKHIIYNDILFFNNKIISYNNLENLNDNNFNVLTINKNFKHFLKNIQSCKNELFRLKKSFLLPPFCFLKRNIAITDNIWYFNNLYNNFFCFCKGTFCLNNMIKYQKCKYKFYLYIIDNNRYVYIYSKIFDLKKFYVKLISL